MSGFFNPQGFLTAMRQEVARAHKGWALDTVTIHNEVTKLTQEECKKPPKVRVRIAMKSFFLVILKFLIKHTGRSLRTWFVPGRCQLGPEEG